MKLPRLDEWNFELIGALAESANEDMDFDFKGPEVMTQPSGISALSKAVTAFSNARGGFIVIGVTDRAPRRLEGIEATLEFTRLLNDRIKVYPAPDLTTRLIDLPSGKRLAVIHVPPGEEGPYATIHDKRTDFYVRTPSGAEPMSWVAIRDSMVRADERRRQGQILLGQFEQWYRTARNYRYAVMAPNHDFPETESWDTTLAHQAYAAVHPWLAKDVHAVNALGQLFQRVNFLNGQVQVMIAQVGAHPQRLAGWRGRMNVNVGGFSSVLVQADAGVRRALGMDDIDYRTKYPEF